jgi:hypothetical protein
MTTDETDSTSRRPISQEAECCQCDVFRDGFLRCHDLLRQVYGCWSVAQPMSREMISNEVEGINCSGAGHGPPQMSTEPVCHCGLAIDQHDGYEGHSPVEMVEHIITVESGNMASDPEYQAFVEGQRKYCQCSDKYAPCDGVLAGGMCDDVQDDIDDDWFDA